MCVGVGGWGRAWVVLLWWRRTVVCRCRGTSGLDDVSLLPQTRARFEGQQTDAADASACRRGRFLFNRRVLNEHVGDVVLDLIDATAGAAFDGVGGRVELHAPAARRAEHRLDKIFRDLHRSLLCLRSTIMRMPCFGRRVMRGCGSTS